MTANELADKLENILTFLEIEYADYEDDEILKQASTMLRQQQEKIDRLLDQYQQLNENLEMWKTGHFTQQAEIESLGKAFEGERKYARYLSKLCIDNKIPIVWSF